MQVHERCRTGGDPRGQLTSEYEIKPSYGIAERLGYQGSAADTIHCINLLGANTDFFPADT